MSPRTRAACATCNTVLKNRRNTTVCTLASHHQLALLSDGVCAAGSRCNRLCVCHWNALVAVFFDTDNLGWRYKRPVHRRLRLCDIVDVLQNNKTTHRTTHRSSHTLAGVRDRSSPATLKTRTSTQLLTRCGLCSLYSCTPHDAAAATEVMLCTF